MATGTEEELDPIDSIVDLEDAIHEGDIHLRDKYQFELKSEYTPISDQTNTHSAEFYIFIPAALRINRYTYTKEDFYHDQTNLIRFKTPEMEFADLADISASTSPLGRIQALYRGGHASQQRKVLKELKIYANIVRSSIRNRANQFIDQLRHHNHGASLTSIDTEIYQLCLEVQQVRDSFLQFSTAFKPQWAGTRLIDYSRYIDEFISNTIERYLTSLLTETQHTPDSTLARASEALKERIFWEQRHRQESEEFSPYANDPERAKEYAIYRQSLLKKFVWQVLFLDITRVVASRPFLQFTAAIAAAFAMLVYVYFLIIWHGGVFVSDSTAFIILSVGLYVVKDRIKEGIKSWSASISSNWFPDFKTKIHTPDHDAVIGYITEYVSFLSKKQVPKELMDVRNMRFHTELERAKRMESILYFKKQVTLYPRVTWAHGALAELNDIFRYNINRFLTKASDAYEEQIHLNAKNGKLERIKAPKVYHVNIIMRNTYEDGQGTPHRELRKYRLVLDKEGIKRIEKVL